jgi:hypothetical protein
MKFLPLTAIAALALLAGAPAARGAVDRHPEARSRALAWTEFDGAFLVDPTSRAEMLNFYWTVFARPYPAVNWTGSTQPAAAGETAELWRMREYAQLNAYRALNFSPAMAEDSGQLSLVQEGALVLALNPGRPLTHAIDASWLGYNETRAHAVAVSLLGAFGEYAGRPALRGMADLFVLDPGDSNAPTVGHRTILLHDGNVSGTIGAAYSPSNQSHYAAWSAPQRFRVNPDSNFIAWPAPGYMPLGLFRRAANQAALRWSFTPSTDERGFDSLRHASVAARVNGISVPVRNLVRNFNPHPLTWEFAEAELNLASITEDTAIEIAITDVVIGGRTTSYRYTVVLFDESTITPVSFAPRSALKNLSTRGLVGGDDKVMVVGFVVSGTLPVRVALRAQGPGLTRYGVPHPAQRPRLQLYARDTTLIGENSGWRQHPDWRLLQGLGLAPATDTEPAMVATLWPGSYTAVVFDDLRADGIGLVEAFNIDPLTPSRLSNLSTRGVVGTDDQTLIAGIIVSNEPRTVVIRTQGPGLAKFGVSDPVADTLLTVVAQDDGRIVADNDNWEADPRNARLRTDLAGFAPTDPREAALVLRLSPGAYTALVAAKTAAGVGLIEVFEVPEP